MIDSQLRTSGVNEPWVLAAMNSVAREDFVPEAMRSAAYIDRAIALGDGRWLASPLAHGLMLEEAAPDAGDKVLLVGDGKGYLAALIERRVATLTTISPAEAIAAQGDAVYSLVVIDGAIEVLPDGVASQLAEGGRIVTGVVERGVTRLATGTKAAGDVALLPVADVGIPELPEFAAPKSWSF